MSWAIAEAWARAQVGTVEHPAGSNSGPGISDWIRAGGGAPGWAWCQYFANAVAVRGGAPQLKTGYTPYVLRGNYRALGFEPLSLATAREGDMVFFKWPGVSHDPCDHVGVLLVKGPGTVTCLEGNTSSGNAGSQNNGGGVWIRTRSRSLVAGAVHVPYTGSQKPDLCDGAGRLYRRGDTGSTVKMLQHWLNKVGAADDRIVEDGEFGPATERRVRQFQRNRNRQGKFDPAHHIERRRGDRPGHVARDVPRRAARIAPCPQQPTGEHGTAKHSTAPQACGAVIVSRGAGRAGGADGGRVVANPLADLATPRFV